MTSCTMIATDYQSTALSGNVTDFNWNERERRHRQKQQHPNRRLSWCIGFNNSYMHQILYNVSD